MRDYVRALSNNAWDGLRNSAYLNPQLIDERGLRFGRRKLLLWRTADGFYDYEPETITVFQPFKDEAPLVRKAVWNRSEDQKLLRKFAEGQATAKFPAPTPTIEVRDARLDPDEFDALLKRATELRIPIVWTWAKERDSVTEDVGMVGFEFYDIAEPQASLRCAWSADLPLEWEPVAAWFGRAFMWLENHFDDP